MNHGSDLPLVNGKATCRKFPFQSTLRKEDLSSFMPDCLPVAVFSWVSKYHRPQPLQADGFLPYSSPLIGKQWGTDAPAFPR